MNETRDLTTEVEKGQREIEKIWQAGRDAAGESKDAQNYAELVARLRAVGIIVDVV